VWFFQNVVEFLILLFHMTTKWTFAMIKPLLPKKAKSIKGEIVFITGAGSGIGRLMSIKLAKLGAVVVCTDIDSRTSQETADMITAEGGTAYSYRLDVSKRHDVYDLAETIKRDIGEVGILINNAGIVTGKHFMHCPDELILKTMDVNTNAHYWTLKSFLGGMIERNQGHVVCIASIAGLIGTPHLVDYSASKFAVVGMMEALAVELHGIADKVNTTIVCPYFISTGMFEGTQTYSPNLLPMQDPDHVAQRVVDGIVYNEEYVWVPKTLLATTILKALQPSSVSKKMADYLRLHDQMTNLTGRAKKD